MTRCQTVPVCSRCGAVYHGNIGCIVCLRALKRQARDGEGMLLRVLIKIRERLDRGVRA